MISIGRRSEGGTSGEARRSRDGSCASSPKRLKGEVIVGFPSPGCNTRVPRSFPLRTVFLSCRKNPTIGRSVRVGLQLLCNSLSDMLFRRCSSIRPRSSPPGPGLPGRQADHRGGTSGPGRDLETIRVFRSAGRRIPCNLDSSLYRMVNSCKHASFLSPVSPISRERIGDEDPLRAKGGSLSQEVVPLRVGDGRGRFSRFREGSFRILARNVLDCKVVRNRCLGEERVGTGLANLMARGKGSCLRIRLDRNKCKSLHL